MIEPMMKVRLACPRGLVPALSALLQEAGTLHVEPSPAEAGALRPQTLDEQSERQRVELERLRDELRRVLQLLPEPAPAAQAAPPRARGARSPSSWTSVAEAVRQIGRQADYLTSRLKACEDELALLAKYQQTMSALAPFLRLVRESGELDHLGLTVEEPAKDGRLLAVLREAMDQLTESRFELFQSRMDERRLAILLVFPKTYTPRIRSLLWEEGVQELRLPASVADKPFGQALRILLKKQVDLPARADRYRRALRDLARSHRGELQAWQEAVRRRLSQLDATSWYYQTELASLIYGWCPAGKVEALRARVQHAFQGKAVLEAQPVSRRDWPDVPVVLRNPPLLKPFEALTRLIGLPRYGSIDPTPFLALGFPLFYGAILGDAGYGLLLAALAWTVRRRVRRHPFARDLATVFLAASGAAIPFGLLFGEVFGDLGERLGLHPVLDRLQAFLPLMAGAIAAGTLHVSLGILLGLVWARRRGDRRDVLAKLGALGLVVAFSALVGGLAGLWRPVIPWALGALLASLAVVFLAQGGRGPMELHNLVNVLSYLRLMGIGVASAALAFAANRLGGLVGSLALAVLVAGPLHVINLLFGVLSPAVQALRLHYVEFFENFLAADGRPYQPFGRTA